MNQIDICNGDGSCLMQHNNGFIKNSEYNCQHNCLLQKCPNCGIDVPQWVLNCNWGTCINCAMEPGSIIYFDLLNVRVNEAISLGARFNTDKQKWYIYSRHKNKSEILKLSY